MRLIDAEKLEGEAICLYTYGGARYVPLDALKRAPTVDAIPVVHGRWIEKVDMVESYLADCTEVFYECSVCECANIGESPYCPNCGAKMDGGVDEDAKN